MKKEGVLYKVSSNKIKQVAFDVDTRVTKKILGDKKYTQIYKDIRTFMENNGFTHIQGSVYLSEKPMSNTRVHILVRQMLADKPYILKCVRTMTQTDVGKRYDMDALFQHDGTPGQFVDMYHQKHQETDNDITYDR